MKSVALIAALGFANFANADVLVCYGTKYSFQLTTEGSWELGAEGFGVLDIYTRARPHGELIAQDSVTGTHTTFTNSRGELVESYAVTAPSGSFEATQVQKLDGRAFTQFHFQPAFGELVRDTGWCLFPAY